VVGPECVKRRKSLVSLRVVFIGIVNFVPTSSMPPWHPLCLAERPRYGTSKHRKGKTKERWSCVTRISADTCGRYEGDRRRSAVIKSSLAFPDKSRTKSTQGPQRITCRLLRTGTRSQTRSAPLATTDEGRRDASRRNA
jgi:hypothetical protein